MTPAMMRTCVRMTSDGSAIVRLQRVLANPRSSALQIRAVAAELPRVGLEDALAILLALLDREPHTFSRSAARWGSRLTLEHRLPLADAQLTLASLATLPGGGARAGAEALIELSDRYGLRRIDELLIEWMRNSRRRRSRARRAAGLAPRRRAGRPTTGGTSRTVTSATDLTGARILLRIRH
jgi:hypothetical protein